MRGKAFRLRWVLLGLLLVHGIASAQDTASLTGTIRDKSVAVLPKADVIIKNTATGAIRQVQSNYAGEYVAAALQPGRYDVIVSAQGFRKYQAERVTLRVA
jgi:carboxypeptidase family protein